MLNKFASHFHHYNCECVRKPTIRNREKNQWLQDYIDEANELLNEKESK